MPVDEQGISLYFCLFMLMAVDGIVYQADVPRVNAYFHAFSGNHERMYVFFVRMLQGMETDGLPHFLPQQVYFIMAETSDESAVGEAHQFIIFNVQLAHGLQQGIFIVFVVGIERFVVRAEDEARRHV